MGLWDFVKKLFGAEAPAPADEGAAGASPGPGATAGPEASYAPPDILGLSADAHRRRALATRPWQSAWAGRFDVIPPASDEHTALVDRGLVLAGKATQAELDELHRIGDAYYRYHQRDVAARIASEEAARRAIADLRAEKARVKAEKKAAAKARREAHRAAVAERKATDIVFLGRGVSRGLADRRSHPERLEQLGLPRLSTPADVARLLDLSVPELRWLAFFSEATERPHYVPFEVPKRSGGTRQLAAPHRKLKAAQRAILKQILERLPPSEAAHGFAKGRSTVTHADQHLRSAVVVCLDLKDFFPTITFHRVRGLFERFGYSPAAASVLAALCTEAPRLPITYDGVTYQVAVSAPALPQGAPTSPAISNLIARNLDRRLAGFANKNGWTYTRYADDLTFSGGPEAARRVPALVRMAEQVAQDEGFVVHPDKTRVMRRGGRQLVTGIVVNDGRGVPRSELRRLRALLHNAKRTGLEAQNRAGIPRFREHIAGKIAYIQMVDPEKGRRLRAELEALDA